MGCKFVCLSPEREITAENSALQLISSISRHDRLENHYNIDEAFETTDVGVIRKATLFDNPSQFYEIKSIYKRRNTDSLQLILHELKFLCELNHPNIEKIHSIYETDDVIHVVTENELGERLSTRLQQKHKLSEEETVIIIKQVLSALMYLHSKGICHRNLKIDVIYLRSTPSGLQVKLGGFAFATEFIVNGQQVLLDSVVGLPLFIAPEVLIGYYNSKCDLWSLGVITYMLLFGRTPFSGENNAEIVANIKRGNYTIPQHSISSSATAFISSLLKTDPNARYSSEEALAAPWLAQALITIN